MKLTLKVWRQESGAEDGHFVEYPLEDVGPEFSLLEALDKLNDDLVARGEDPVAFDSDCREGICGACGVTVDGRPHGPQPKTPSCRQHAPSRTGPPFSSSRSAAGRSPWSRTWQ